MGQNILFEESAVKIVLSRLSDKGYKWNYLQYINKGRYCIVFGKEILCICLKKEPFKKFGVKFEKDGERGMGDSINSEHIKRMIQLGVKWVYTIFADGKLYRILLQDIIHKSHRWKQKEGTEVRSFSIHHYERVE